MVSAAPCAWGSWAVAIVELLELGQSELGDGAPIVLGEDLVQGGLELLQRGGVDPRAEDEPRRVSVSVGIALAKHADLGLEQRRQ